MEQYIKKSALVAWVKSRLLPTINSNADEFERGEDNERIQTLNFINNLEVKEVDLEKEIESWRHNHFHGRKDKEASGEYLERVSQLDLAKHFFELGLKAYKGK